MLFFCLFMSIFAMILVNKEVRIDLNLNLRVDTAS